MRNCLSLLSLLAVSAFLSCNRDKPQYLDLPGEPFDVTLTEQRCSRTFHWQVRQNERGAWITDNGEESVQTLCITAYNSPVVLETTADVNVESSDPKVVAVEHQADGDNRRFNLSYKGDGTVVIRLWNGGQETGYSKQFRAEGAECVDVTGIRFTYGGEPLVITRSSLSRPKIIACDDDAVHEDEYGWSNKTRPTETDFTWHQYMKPDIYDEDLQTFVIDPNQGTVLRFEGLEPENTSFRIIAAFESEWDYYRQMTRSLVSKGIIREGEYADWPNVRGISEDVSVFEGREIWISRLGAPTYVASILVKAREDKYFWLYYTDKGETQGK